MNYYLPTYEECLKIVKNNEAFKIKEEYYNGKKIQERYYDEIVKNTEELGPYYFLSPGIAMPHARPEGGVNRNCFGLTVLKEPIKFGKEEHEYAQILIRLAATSSDIHAEEAIPQIVMLFDDEANFDKLVNATTVEEVLEIL